ncbi:Trypsin domain protein [Roseibacterium elongatum DSM 19469]|uniref:Trypsin domain protein n=1 Tax=Roseicyclus elongatus DSM 19469 TaxID=1294273 RepID=W8S5C1_9RHOB|nr:trypsin-like peptidase domain-containing protein [Roseibacterium elongatum]AHM04006.1 Trypsin domain protein [Roseibacterium elongatum DSM 19469]
MQRLFGFLLTLLFACPAIAQQDSPLRVLQTGDDSRGWEAVGRLDTGIGFCTATLIAPDLVLTAAHCLFHPDSGARLDDRDLSFQAGLRNGRPEAIRHIRRGHVMPGYSVLRGIEMDMIARDLALLELDLPVGSARFAPIAAGGAAPLRGAVTVVSYGADREDAPSLQDRCTILGGQGVVRSLSCRIDRGSSGAPVLRMTAHGPRVVAVMSATGRAATGQPRSVSVAIEAALPVLLSQRAGAATGAAGGTMRPDRGRLGAHFIRP